MKTIFKRLFLSAVILLMFTAKSYSQFTKLKTKSVSVKTEEDDTWTDWKGLKILVTVDVDNKKVKIYTTDIQTYDVVGHLDSYTTDSGFDAEAFLCVDNRGKDCRIDFVKDPSEHESTQIYISLADIKVVYNVVPYD